MGDGHEVAPEAGMADGADGLRRPVCRLTYCTRTRKPHSLGDLLEVQPLDLGPGTPATIALEHERGPQPHDANESGDQ
jgi:hypothetical protein